MGQNDILKNQLLDCYYGPICYFYALVYLRGQERVKNSVPLKSYSTFPSALTPVRARRDRCSISATRYEFLRRKGKMTIDDGDGLAAFSEAIAAAEAELDATLNESIDIGNSEKVMLSSDRSICSEGSSSNNYHDDDDDLQVLALEDLAKELSALDDMRWAESTQESGNNGPQPFVAAPFEGKGRRARARRARIKREIKAREGAAARQGTSESTKEPLRSLSTSSLGRPLAESKSISWTSSQPQKDAYEERQNRPSDSNNKISPERKPFEGKGRSARARRAKERREAEAKRQSEVEQTNRIPTSTDIKDFPNFSLRSAVLDK